MIDNKEQLLNEIIELSKQELRNEIYKEFNKREENKKKGNELASELYEKYDFTDKIVLKYLKRSLPLNIRIFNKITVIGKALLYNNIIQYTYYFNNKHDNVFVFKPHLEDMMNWD